MERIKEKGYEGWEEKEQGKKKETRQEAEKEKKNIGKEEKWEHVCRGKGR